MDVLRHFEAGLYCVFRAPMAKNGLDWVRICQLKSGIAPTGSNFQRAKHFVGDFWQKSMDLVDE